MSSFSTSPLPPWLCGEQLSCNKLVPLLGQESPGPCEKVQDLKSIPADSFYSRCYLASPLFPQLHSGMCAGQRESSERHLQPATSKSFCHRDWKPFGRDALPGTHCWDQARPGRGSCSEELTHTHSQSSVVDVCELYSLPLPTWCESKPFKPCSFLMQSFLHQTGLSWASHLPPPSSTTPEQPTRAYSWCPSVTHVLPVHPPCSPWPAPTFSDGSRHLFLLLGAESRGWFLHVPKGSLRALADSQCRDPEVSSQRKQELRKQRWPEPLLYRRQPKAGYIIPVIHEATGTPCSMVSTCNSSYKYRQD